MEGLAEILTNIKAATAGLTVVLYTFGVAILLDVLTGIWAAVQSGTFDSKFLPEFISGHLVRRVTPLTLGLVAGVAVGGTGEAAGLAILGVTGAGIAAYLGSLVTSIVGNIQDGQEGTKGLPSTVQPPTLQLTPLTDIASPDEV